MAKKENIRFGFTNIDHVDKPLDSWKTFPVCLDDFDGVVFYSTSLINGEIYIAIDEFVRSPHRSDDFEELADLQTEGKDIDPIVQDIIDFEWELYSNPEAFA